MTSFYPHVFTSCIAFFLLSSDAPLAKNEAANAYVGHVLLPHSTGVYGGLELQVVVTWHTLFLKAYWSNGPGSPGTREAFQPQEVS